jgi:hypothetical protein
MQFHGIAETALLNKRLWDVDSTGIADAHQFNSHTFPPVVGQRLHRNHPDSAGATSFRKACRTVRCRRVPQRAWCDAAQKENREVPHWAIWPFLGPVSEWPTMHSELRAVGVGGFGVFRQ